MSSSNSINSGIVSDMKEPHVQQSRDADEECYHVRPELPNQGYIACTENEGCC